MTGREKDVELQMAPTSAPDPPPSAPGRRRRRRRFAGFLVGAATLLMVLPVTSHPAGDLTPGEAQVLAKNTAALYGLENAITSSALTLSGQGESADLKVTVGQTQNLVNQSIAVTWAWGGADPAQHASILNGSTVQANYLQIMQCWGDSAPDRAQCEFGGFRSLQNGQTYAASRRIFPASDLTGPIDPAEPNMTAGDPTYRDYQYDTHANGTFDGWTVPFRSVTGEVFRHDDPPNNPFYGEFDTNELPYSLTRPDGKGFETFETVTYRESAGLGCADLRTSDPGRGTPRNCWLVVVPRGTTEVNGKPYTAAQNVSPAQLESSPLSATNWANRLAFPLSFEPIGQPCPISAKQRLVGGVETSMEAVLRWQPALCRNGGAVYGYSKLADAIAEGPLTGSGSSRGLSFLNAPVDPSTVPGDRTLVYAPVAVSGLSIAAMVETVPTKNAPASVQVHVGERISDLKLTPRLVAKLLTQSYKAGVEPNVALVPGYLAGNPFNIDEDPEFLALNPRFKDLTGTYVQIMLPTGVASTSQVLWTWISGDEEARDFVAGVPDPWGMRVNPFYQGLQIPQETLPKIDPYCRHDSGGLGFPQLCAFDLHPAVADFHDGARQVSQGNTLSLQWPAYPVGYKLLPTDPVYQKVSRETPGSREILGLTDTATAARYQLTSVQLRNSAGQFVAPTTATMLAGAAAMTPSGVGGVKSPNPNSTAGNAYPLTMVTYAVAAPNQLSADAAKDYAAFVRYAVTSGQTVGTAPGQLPYGYAPLPSDLRQQALKAAIDIQNRVGPRTAASGGGGGSGSGSGQGSTAPAPAATPTVATPAPSPSSITLAQAKPAGSRTPDDALLGDVARYAVIAVATLGLLGLLVGPLLPRLAQRIRR